MRLCRLLPIALGLLAPLTASADVIPHMIDLSGIWVLEHRPYSTQHSTGRCDHEYFAYLNYPLYGNTYLELRATGVRSTNRGRRVVFEYEGTLNYAQGFASSERTPGVGVTVDYFCHLEIFRYAMSGELEWDRNAREVELDLTGSIIGSSPYMHGTGASVRQARTYVPPPGVGNSILFADRSGDFIQVWVSTGGYVNDRQYPAGCDEWLKPPNVRVFSLSFCRPDSYSWFTLRRASSPPELAAGGRVHGQTFMGFPDGTRSNDVVSVGQVRLYAQDEFIRARNPGESEEDYRAYRAARLAARRLVGERRVDGNGEFEFLEVPILEPVPHSPSRAAYRRKMYTIEVTGAQTEEVVSATEPPRTVYFATKTIENVGVEYDEQIVLIPFDGIEVKRELADKLEKKGPN